MRKLSRRCEVLGWIRLAALAVLWMFAAQTAHAKPFTLPVIPDSQREVDARPQMLRSQLEWIVANRDKMNIPIVLHVGDIVDYHNDVHWKTASDLFTILDEAKMPYALTLGNHDTAAVGEWSGSAAPGNVNLNLRNTAKFNNAFPVSRFPLQKGRWEEHKSDNAYYAFEAGGLKWLVVTLEFCARQAPVDWASGVMLRHPDHNAIIVTHYHLTGKGEINNDNAGYGDMNTKTIFEQMMRRHANLLMVLSGHVMSSAHRTDAGEKGNVIYQILQNYQNEDFGGGYLRLLDIDPEAGTISARMYSPFYQKTRTEEGTNFAFSKVKFIK